MCVMTGPPMKCFYMKIANGNHRTFQNKPAHYYALAPVAWKPRGKLFMHGAKLLDFPSLTFDLCQI